MPVIPGLSADLRPEPTDAEKREYARAVAARNNIDPASYERQIQQESGFDTHAYNKRSGAAGIAQFMPDTAREQGVDPYDWRASLEAGARYRAKQRDYFKGDERAGLAAYNYGAGNVENLMRQYGADWEANLPTETKDYLRIVGGGQPDTSGPGIGITQTGDVGGRAVGSMFRGLEPVSNVPGYRYNTRGLEKITPPGIDPTVHGWYDTDPTKMRWDARTLDNYSPGTDYTHQDGYPDKPPLVPFDPNAYEVVGGRNAGIARLGSPNHISPPGVDPTVHPPLDTGDVPYDAGVRGLERIAPPGVDPSVHPLDPGGAAKAALQRFNDSSGFLGLGNTGTLTGAATGKIGPLEDFANAGRDAFRQGGNAIGDVILPGRMVGPGGPGGPAPQRQGDNIIGSAAAQIPGFVLPETPLDAGLMYGGNLLKGAGALRGLTKVEPGMLGIIPKNAKELDKAMAETLRIAEEAKQAVLARGGSAQEARKAAADAMRTAGKDEAYNAQRDYRVEQEMQNPFRAGAENKARTDAMKDAMGPGVVEDTGNAARTGARAAEAPLSPEEIAALGREPTFAERYGVPAYAGDDPNAPSNRLLDAVALAKKVGNPQEVIRGKLEGGQEGSAAGKPVPAPATSPVHPAPSSNWNLLDKAINQWHTTVAAVTDPAADRNILHNVAAIPGVVQAAISSLDLGNILRQNQALGWRDPRGWLNAAKQTYHAFGDPAVEAAAKASMEASPVWDLATGATRQDRANALADLLYKQGHGVSANLQNVEAGGRSLFIYGKDAAHAVPGREGLDNTLLARAAKSLGYMEAGERAYATGANVQGMKTFEDLAKPLIAAGVDDLKTYEDIMHVVNLARGRSGTQLAENLGKLRVLFSPQFMLSRPQLLNAMRDGTLSPEARKLAQESVVSMAAGQASLLGLLGVSGAATGLWSVNANPLDTDFAKLRVGNTTIDAAAGFGPLIKTTARISAKVADGTIGTDMAGDVASIEDSVRSFLENKAAPVPGILEKGIMHKQWPELNPLKEGGWRTYVNLMAPMIALSVYDSIAANKGGTKLPAAALTAASELVGAGSNTYQTNQDQANEAAQNVLGKPFEQATTLEKARALQSLPDDVASKVKPEVRKELTAAKTSAGYDSPTANTTALDRANPTIDVQSWALDRGTVHSIAAVDQALQSGIDQQDIRLAGLKRSVNQDENSRKAWEYSKKPIDWFLNDVVPQNADTFIKDFAGKDPKNAAVWKKADGSLLAYDQLPPDLKTKVSGAIKAQALDPELHAWLVWWGERDEPKNDPKVSAALDKITQQYGGKPYSELSGAIKKAVVAASPR